MTQEKITPLRERMIPLGTLLRNTLPGSGIHAYPRDGRQGAESPHSGNQALCWIFEEVA